MYICVVHMEFSIDELTFLLRQGVCENSNSFETVVDEASSIMVLVTKMFPFCNTMAMSLVLLIDLTHIGHHAIVKFEG